MPVGLPIHRPDWAEPKACRREKVLRVNGDEVQLTEERGKRKKGKEIIFFQGLL